MTLQGGSIDRSSGGEHHRWLNQIRDTIRALSPDDTQPLPVIPAVASRPSPELVELLRALGAALLNSTDSAATATQTLQDVAAANGVDLQAMVLPTGILLRFSGSEVDLVTVPNRPLRLDQVAWVRELVTELVAGRAGAKAGLLQLDRMLRTAPRFGAWGALLGQVILAVGFGLLINPDLLGLPFFAALGLIVGLLRMVAGWWGTLSVALPALASFLVTLLTIQFVAPNVDDDPIRLVVPALTTFFPTAALTIATIELTSDQIISGSSRLVWGVSQLLLLAFGVFAGITLVGYPQQQGAQQAGAWAPWIGVAVVGLGYLLYSNAPRGSMPFLLVALYISYAAQTFGAALLDPTLSGLIGGLVVVPVTHLLAKVPTSPPADMLVLPAFWLLLPGALGFQGVSELAAGSPFGAEDVVNTAISVFAVAVGVLVGMSVTRDVGAVQRTWRFRPHRRN